MKDIYTTDKLSFFQRHFQFMEGLANGTRQPSTERQRQFIEVARKQADPKNEFEYFWRIWKLVSSHAQETTKIMSQMKCQNDELKKEKDGREWQKKVIDQAQASSSLYQSQIKSLREEIRELRNKYAASKAKVGIVTLSEEEANSVLKALDVQDKDKSIANKIIQQIRENHRKATHEAASSSNYQTCPQCGGDGGAGGRCPTCGGNGML